MIVRLPAIFPKAEVTKPADTPESRLAVALYGPAVSRPAPPAVPPVQPPAPPRETPLANLLFALDATASREHVVATSIQLTDALLQAVPGHLRVALAFHGGSKVKLFTDYEKDIGKLRDIAASIRCEGGTTRMLDILARALKTAEGLTSVIYTGDVFEESRKRALSIAAALAARSVRLFILLDEPHASNPNPAFAEMAELTGGCVLPFDANAISHMRDLLSAIGVFAVGGTEMLAAKQETMPAARLLLQHIKGNTK